MPGSVATKRRGFSWEAFSSTAPPLIYATGGSSLTMNGPPNEYSAPNFSMPPVKAHAAPYAEHYFLARYTSRLADGTACRSDGDECCGLIRELPFWYTLARGGGAKDRRYLTCDYSLNRTWRVLRAAERADHAVAVEACAVADARRFFWTRTHRAPGVPGSVQASFRTFPDAIFCAPRVTRSYTSNFHWQESPLDEINSRF